MYLCYPEYLSLGGTLDENANFFKYEFEAEQVINKYTYNRLKTETVIPEEVKRLIVELVSIINTRETNLISSVSTNITQQSNDGVSVSYNVMSPDVAIQHCNSEVKRCIFTFLDGVKSSDNKLLLYRGLYPGE